VKFGGEETKHLRGAFRSSVGAAGFEKCFGEPGILDSFFIFF